MESALSAEERAARIRRAIVAAARDRTVSPDSLRLVESDLGIRIMAGQTLLTTVVEADADVEGVRPDQLASVLQSRIGIAIEAYRADRAPRALVLHALFALGGFVLLVVALRLVLWAARHTRRWLQTRIGEQVEAVQSRTAQLVRADRVWMLLDGVVATARTLAVLVLVYSYLQASLGLFPWTRRVGLQLLGLVVGPLATMATAIVDYIPKLFFLLILVFVTRWALKLIRTAFGALETGRLVISGFYPEWATPTYRIVRVLVVALAVVVAYPYIPGSQSSAFTGVTLLLGALVSLGSSSVVSNVLAGYTMVYRRAFALGDLIEVNDVYGEVTKIRAMVTTVLTPLNQQVVLPNSVILNSPVVNYSALEREGAYLVQTSVGIGYETPWRQVEAMLLLAAERTEGVAGGRAPFVWMRTLGDFAVVYQLNVPCADARGRLGLITSLNRNVLDVFNEYGVQIMTPAYVRDPDTPKVVERDQWFAPPAAAGAPEAPSPAPSDEIPRSGGRRDPHGGAT